MIIAPKNRIGEFLQRRLSRVGIEKSAPHLLFEMTIGRHFIAASERVTNGSFALRLTFFEHLV